MYVICPCRPFIYMYFCAPGLALWFHPTVEDFAPRKLPGHFVFLPDLASEFDYPEDPYSVCILFQIYIIGECNFKEIIV